MHEQKQHHIRGIGSHGNGQKKRLKMLKKVLDKHLDARYNIKAVTENVRRQIEVWLSLVERFVRDEEAAGSNPVTSTTKTLKTTWFSEFFAI